jgi:hypothetical protein
MTQIALLSPAKPIPDVALILPPLPFELPAVTGFKPQWNVQIPFKVTNDSLSVIFENEPIDVETPGKTVLNLVLHPGANLFKLTTVDARGAPTIYEVQVQVETTQLEEEAGAFLVGGPVAFAHSISRSGTAATVNGTSSSTLLGLRGIYRRRMAKDITDRLPGSLKLFFDGSGTLGRTVAGDDLSTGTIIWADTRLTLEVFQRNGFRIEGGAGFTFFTEFPTQSIPGDVQNFLGFVLSTRVGYPITPKLYVLAGVNFTLPSSSDTSTDTLVTQPFEAFLSTTFPRGTDGFYEIRIKYFNLSTTGTILNAGNFQRNEMFFGPEFLISKKF